MKKEWEYAQRIIERIQAAGGEAYIVGGAVRDYLQGKTPSDIDLASNLFPEDIMRLFPKSIPTGIDHGTVTVIVNHRPFEVTTFRTEGTYSDNRRPDSVELGATLEQDMMRRDFTMNAMAFENGHVIDPFGGQEDMRLGRIRTVGKAMERFDEDALRIMRAFRFMAQLDFTLDDEVKEAASRLRVRLASIAVERIAIEFEKLMLGPAHQKALRAMWELGIHHYLPQVDDALFKRLMGESRVLTQPLHVWGVLVYHAENVTLLNAWKRSNKIKREAQVLASLLRTGLSTRAIYDACEETLTAYLVLVGDETPCAKLKADLVIRSRKELAFDGKDAIRLGARGPVIKQLLYAIEDDVLHGRVENERELLEVRAQTWLRQKAE